MATTGKFFTGKVVSDKMQNTISVAISSHHRHPLYQKNIDKTSKVYADNNLSAKSGDTVKIKEVRPISKLKRFTTVEIISKNSNL